MITILIFSFLLVSCASKEARDEKNSMGNFLGRYVSEGYSRRLEGYDWISILITGKKGNAVDISVRSRSDIKNPTCTFDSVGTIIDKFTIKSEFNGKNILFKVDNKTLKIEMEKEADRNLLYYFCSGGATLEGTYKKID